MLPFFEDMSESERPREYSDSERKKEPTDVELSPFRRKQNSVGFF